MEIDACFPETRGCELEVSTYYRWELIRSYEYSESAHRNRHMILTISSHIDVDDGQGLCFHELGVCVNAMTHVVLNGNHPVSEKAIQFIATDSRLLNILVQVLSTTSSCVLLPG